MKSNLLFGWLLFALALHCNAQNQKSYLLKAGKIYDSENNIFVKDQDILITGNRIVKVGGNIEIPENSKVIDLTNATVTPGLIDAHTHLLMEQKITDRLEIDAIVNSGESRLLRAISLGKTYLNAGFTTVRDLGNSGQYLDVELRNAINMGYVDGPRMFVSGPIIGSYDGQFGGLPFAFHSQYTEMEYRTVNGVDDARLAAKEHRVQFVDVLKILAYGNSLSLSKEEIQAIVEVAHENRITVTAHADRDWVAQNAINAGVDGIEHNYNISDKTIDLMIEKGVYFVPTHGSVELMIIARKNLNIDFDEQQLRKDNKPDGRLLNALKKGVMIVAGSDAYYNFGIPRGEASKYTILGYFDAGFKPNEALRTATYNAAIALNKKDKLGVIKENALADIVVFNGDLEANFKEVLFKVKWVMKDGKIVHNSID